VCYARRQPPAPDEADKRPRMGLRPAKYHTGSIGGTDSQVQDVIQAHGRYTIICYGPDGNERWRDISDNLVTNQGKDANLDTFFAGSSYSVTGPFCGLIGNVSYTSGPNVADTMAQLAGTNGWRESGGANAPTYSGNRKTMTFNAASAGSKTTTAAVAFGLTGSGTAKGVFVVMGTGAVNTKEDDLNGVLWSAGLFAGGEKSVSSGDTLNVTYSISL
jgi:hypothetical protein